MTGPDFVDLQEALFIVFNPILYWFLVFLAATGGISAIGVVILGIVAKFSPRN